MRKIPLRTCIGCRDIRPKQELIRIVRAPSGKISVDVSGKANGRGAYLCPSEDCFSQAVKKKALTKALDVDIDEDTLKKVETELISCVEGTKMTT